MTNSHLNITHKLAVSQCHPLLSPNYFWGEEVCVEEKKESLCVFSHGQNTMTIACQLVKCSKKT